MRHTSGRTVLGAILAGLIALPPALIEAQTFVYRTTADNSPMVVTPPGGGGSDGAGSSGSCLDPANVGLVGQAGWSGCAGMLIVDDAMNRPGFTGG